MISMLCDIASFENAGDSTCNVIEILNLTSDLLKLTFVAPKYSTDTITWDNGLSDSLNTEPFPCEAAFAFRTSYSRINNLKLVIVSTLAMIILSVLIYGPC